MCHNNTDRFQIHETSWNLPEKQQKTLENPPKKIKQHFGSTAVAVEALPRRAGAAHAAAAKGRAMELSGEQ